MDNTFFELVVGDGPIVGAAIHNGHDVRKDIEEYFALNESERLREEDPYTDGWAEVAPSTIKVSRSRFEVDLNRSRDKAIYLKPEDAWGLHVWNRELPDSIIQRSLVQYDSFYNAVKVMLQKIYDRFGYIIVLDIHTYNYKRNGANGIEAEPKENPEINVGTSNMDRELWSQVVNGFMNDLRQFEYFGSHLDVRENVKFKGGYFSNWIHNQFPHSSCALAIEFKKIFMDEWTGEIDRQKHVALFNALKQTLPGLLKNSKTIFEHA